MVAFLSVRWNRWRLKTPLLLSTKLFANPPMDLPIQIWNLQCRMEGWATKPVPLWITTWPFSNAPWATRKPCEMNVDKGTHRHPHLRMFDDCNYSEWNQMESNGQKRHSPSWKPTCSIPTWLLMRALLFWNAKSRGSRSKGDSFSNWVWRMKRQRHFMTDSKKSQPGP